MRFICKIIILHQASIHQRTTRQVSNRNRVSPHRIHPAALMPPLDRRSRVARQVVLVEAARCIAGPANISMAHIVPYSGSHDTRLGRESSWPKVPSGSHFFRPLMVKGFVCALTGRATFWFPMKLPHAA
jgi:hypothetical protein